MKAKAAVLFEANKGLQLCDVDVQEPQTGEVMIRSASGEWPSPWVSRQ